MNEPLAVQKQGEKNMNFMYKNKPAIIRGDEMFVCSQTQ